MSILNHKNGYIGSTISVLLLKKKPDNKTDTSKTDISIFINGDISFKHIGTNISTINMSILNHKNGYISSTISVLLSGPLAISIPIYPD
jgi:hypothetical protein